LLLMELETDFLKFPIFSKPFISRNDCAITGKIVKKVRILEFFLVALDRAR